MSELVEIERMGYGADAIAHASNGKTLFVAGAVPGDKVTLEIVQDKKTYARAKIVSIEEPSSHRVSKLPPDALASGATWAHLDYEMQLSSKKANVADALRRNAHLDGARIEEVLKDIIPCKNEWGYRNKIELSAFRDNSGKFCLGAHELGSKSNVALKKAPLANRLIEDAPKALTGVLRYLQGCDDLGIYRVGMRASLRTKSVEVALWTPPSSFPRNFAAKAIKDACAATSIVRVLAEPGSARRIKKVEVLEGAGAWSEKMGWKSTSHLRDTSSKITSQLEDSSDQETADTVALFDYRVSAPSFFQVNTAQAEVLIGLVLEGLGVEAGMHVADLYSGVGAFSLPLAEMGASVSAIEIAGSSTRDLVRNCDAAALDVDVICDDTAIALPSLGLLDAIVVDPPRSGLEEKVIDQIADASPASVAYVSCDPQTLARDIGRLAGRGYVLQSVVPVDLFPQTYHVECVAILAKK